MKPTAPSRNNLNVIAAAVLAAVATFGLLSALAESDAPRTPRLLAGADTDVLICWFVESDGQAHHGYAAQDARLDSISPQGGGLFPTREDFQAALGKLQVERLAAGRPRTTLESVEYPGNVPKGWKIRSLTATELKQLRGY